MQRLLAFFFAAALLWTPAWSQSAPDALVPDLSQYILTPPAPPTPRINGAKVFGARPGSEFLFAIPASGDRPMTFAAEGLPKGLSLDPSTGFITSRAPTSSNSPHATHSGKPPANFASSSASGSPSRRPWAGTRGTAGRATSRRSKSSPRLVRWSSRGS